MIGKVIDFFGGHWVRIGAALLIVGAIAYAAMTLVRWQAAYEELPAVQAKLEAEEACAEGSKCWIRGIEAKAEQADKIQEAVDVYEQELAALRARPVERRVIRVCPDAGTGDVPGGTAAAGSDGAGAAKGVLLRPDELDTRPLRELALLADEVSARLRACQGWANAVAPPEGAP